MALLRLVGCLVVTVALSTGCSGGGSDGEKARTIPELPTYDRSSCRDIQPFEGGDARTELHSATNVASDPSFAKPYDRADLDAVLEASAVQTSIYVMDMGVSVYRIPRNANQCPMFYALPEVPSNLRAVWDEVAGGAGEGQLAGAYFEICEGTCPDYSLSNPTILVHEASDRWTLVHEMMHHNFNVFRKADTNRESLNRVREHIRTGQINLERFNDAFDASKSRDDLTSLANQAYSMVGNLYVLMIYTTFEEIAVEALLLEEAAEGRLNYISRESPASALWYIRLSRQDGLRHFSAFTDLFQKILREARRNEWRDIITTVERAQSEIDFIRRKTSEILDKAEANARRAARRSNIRGRIVNGLGEYSPMVSEASFHSHVSGRDGYQTLEDFSQAMDRLNSQLNTK